MVREPGDIIEAGAPLAGERPEAAERKLAAALGPRTGHVVVVAASAEDAERLLYRVEMEMVAYRCAWLDGGHLETADLLRALESEARDTSSLPATMRALAAEARAIGRPVVLVVRRADSAPAAQLERLRLAVDAGEASDWLRLVLLGGPALLAALREPGGRALASRVTSLVIMEDAAGAAVRLGATSELMQAPNTAARRRPAVWRIVLAGGLGAAVAAAAGPLLLRLHTPAGIAVSPTPAPVARDPRPQPAEPAAAPEADAAAGTPEAPASPGVTAPPQAIVHEPASPDAGRSVQVGAFRDAARAAALRDELAKRFEWVMVTQVERDGVVWYRVRVEGLPTAAAVRDAVAALRRAGHQPTVVR